jgi:hypothetical protein
MLCRQERPDPSMMPKLLFVIYAIHLAIFAFAWRRRREGVYGVLVAAFVLLLVSHALRVFAPDLRMGSVAAFWPPRVVAWICAALGLTLLVWRRLRRSKKR